MALGDNHIRAVSHGLIVSVRTDGPWTSNPVVAEGYWRDSEKRPVVVTESLPNGFPPEARVTGMPPGERPAPTSTSRLGALLCAPTVWGYAVPERKYRNRRWLQGRTLA